MLRIIDILNTEQLIDNNIIVEKISTAYKFLDESTDGIFKVFTPEFVMWYYSTKSDLDVIEAGKWSLHGIEVKNLPINERLEAFKKYPAITAILQELDNIKGSYQKSKVQFKKYYNLRTVAFIVLAFILGLAFAYLLESIISISVIKNWLSANFYPNQIGMATLILSFLLGKYFVDDFQNAIEKRVTDKRLEAEIIRLKELTDAFDAHYQSICQNLKTTSDQIPEGIDEFLKAKG